MIDPKGFRPDEPTGAGSSVSDVVDSRFGPPSDRPHRPFTGYDREREAYARHKGDLLARAAGKYVVVVGEDVEGPVETFEAAVRLGYRRFGLGPLYVKQILAEEPVVEVSRDVIPCRS